VPYSAPFQSLEVQHIEVLKITGPIQTAESASPAGATWIVIWKMSKNRVAPKHRPKIQTPGGKAGEKGVGHTTAIEL